VIPAYYKGIVRLHIVTYFALRLFRNANVVIFFLISKKSVLQP
jgi:hypothetical protein